MESLINEFNGAFKGQAEAIIKGNRLEITINNVTLSISLPWVISVRSKGLSDKS